MTKIKKKEKKEVKKSDKKFQKVVILFILNLFNWIPRYAYFWANYFHIVC